MLVTWADEEGGLGCLRVFWGAELRTFVGIVKALGCQFSGFSKQRALWEPNDGMGTIMGAWPCGSHPKDSPSRIWKNTKFE